MSKSDKMGFSKICQQKKKNSKKIDKKNKKCKSLFLEKNNKNKDVHLLNELFKKLKRQKYIYDKNIKENLSSLGESEKETDEITGNGNNSLDTITVIYLEDSNLDEDEEIIDINKN